MKKWDRVCNTLWQAAVAAFLAGLSAVHQDWSSKTLRAGLTAGLAAAFSYLQHSVPALLGTLRSVGESPQDDEI